MKKIFKPLVFAFLLAISSIFFVGKVEVAEAASPSVKSASPSALDSAYDLRDYIDIQVEYQGSYGICWAYASLTSLETYLALNYGEYYDFSELHLAVSAYAQDGYYDSLNNALTAGGNFENLFTYAQKNNDFVLEDEYSISNYTSITSKMLTDYAAVNANHYSLAKINNTRKFASHYGDKTGTDLTEFRKSVKSHIISNGSISTAIRTSGATWTASQDLCVTLPTLAAEPAQAVDHMVSIIGWDDNYNANGAWSQAGAYLCLNSWGNSWGSNGCFYISYNDYFVEYCMQGVSSAVLADAGAEYNTYQSVPDQTFTQQHIFSAGSITTAQVLDVSPYLNKQIESLDFFIQGSSTVISGKFFGSLSDALNGLNSTTSSLNCSLSARYSVYDRYTLSSPITISNNYLLIVGTTSIDTSSQYHTSTSLASKTASLEQNCFVQTDGRFNTSRTWSNILTHDNADTFSYTLPIRLHFAGAVEATQFTGDADSIVQATLLSGNKQYLKNNATFPNKTITCTIKNATVDPSQVKIRKTNARGSTDVTSKFSINLTGGNLSITLSKSLDSTFTAGNYIVVIPTDAGTVYRAIEVQDEVTYLISYHLDGGTASSNPKFFTNKQTSLNLTAPTKDGYVFVGWYTNADFSTAFSNTDLPHTSLDLYAKYDIACPTLLSKTSDINCVYSKNNPIELEVKVKHALENSFNTISYQWYKKDLTGGEFVKLSGETNSTISLDGVSASGYYACEISITITDPSLVASPCVKTLAISDKSTIKAVINKFVYDMSNAKWDYTKTLFYNATEQSVSVSGLPNGVTVNYTGNSATEIGSYTAHAELVYDDMDGNAFAQPIADLNWSIRKAIVTITIKDIISEDELTLEVLKSKFNCELKYEYLPASLSTQAQRLEYLGFEYLGPIDTEQLTIKTISGQVSSSPSIQNYLDITIINGVYRYVAKTLQDKNSSGINAYNPDGFTADCQFEVSYISSVDEHTQKLLSSAHLTLVRGYNLKFSYLREDDKYIVTLPIERNDLLAQLHIFIVKDGKLVRVNQTDISTSGLTIEADELDAKFLIVEADTGHTSNTQKLAIILIACGFTILYVVVIVEHIRKKRRLW